jgi:hypothetical protein
MPPHWLWEAQDQKPDPETGAAIFHLTSSPSQSFTPDGESPVASPDGRRVLIKRSRDVNLDPDIALLVSDLETKRLALIDRIPAEQCGTFASGWADGFAYTSRDGDLIRVDWESLAPQPILSRTEWGALPGLPRNFQDQPALPRRGGALSADGRYLFYVALLPGPCPALIRIDLEQRRADVLHEQPDMINSHLQTEPGAGRWVMMQINTGASLNPDGTPRSWGNAPVQLLVQPVTGGPVTRIYGGTDLPHCTGHECFVPGAGQVIMSADWPTEDPRAAEEPDNLALAFTDGAPPRLLPTAPFRFFHVGPSRCGRYFVADELYDGPHKPPALVIGNLQTGRCRYLLRDCGCPGCGGNVISQPRPVFMADNRHIVFGRSFFGLTQVAAVRIPDGFLETLD